MRRPISALALAAVAFGTALAGDGEPVHEAHLLWERGPALRRTPIAFQLSEGAPARVHLPDRVQDPRHGRAPVAGVAAGSVDVVVDLSLTPPEAWIDRDLDGRLDDERPVHWTRMGLRWSLRTSVMVPPERGAEAVPVEVKLIHGAFDDEDRLFVESGAHRAGALSVGGRLVAIAAYDGDRDLDFDGPKDAVLIDLDGDGAFDRRPFSPEFVTPGAQREIDGELLEVHVDDDGSQLRFSHAGAVEHSRVNGVAGAPVEASSTSLEDLFQAISIEGPERVEALRELGTLGTDDARALLEHFARGDASVRERVEAVLALGNPAYVDDGAQCAIEFTKVRESAIVVAAVRALHRMGHPDRMKTYAGLLRNGPDTVVEEAALHAVMINDSESRATLQRTLEERSSPRVRRALYEGVRAAPMEMPRAFMVAAAQDEGARLRVMALRDLVEAGDGRARRLILETAEVTRSRVLARELLSLLGAVGDAPAAEHIVRLGADHLLERDARDMLMRMDSAGVEQRLMTALDDSDPKRRALAARAIADRGLLRAESRLIGRLRDEPDEKTRRALLDSVGLLGMDRAVEVVEESFDDGTLGGKRAFLRMVATPWMRGVDPTLRAVRRTLRDPSWRIRESALLAMVAIGDDSLLDDLRAALSDTSRTVRSAAAAALGEIRSRDSVPILIDMLDGEKSQRVRDAVAMSLFRITGTNLYDDHALWSLWVAENGDTFVVPEVPPVLPAEAVAGTSAPPAPNFYGIELDAESVVFVIDQSGSMEGPTTFGAGSSGVERLTKFKMAVKELLSAVDALDDGTHANVVLFETNVRSWRERPATLNRSTRRALKRYMARQEPSGATCLYNGLELGLLADGVDTVVLLSDGAPTHGKHVEPNQIVAAVRDLNKGRDVVIHCVAVGGHSTLLRRLSSLTGGEYVVR